MQPVELSSAVFLFSLCPNLQLNIPWHSLIIGEKHIYFYDGIQEVCSACTRCTPSKLEHMQSLIEPT